MRTLNDEEARKLTSIARELELVRTPTAPLVQRQTALSHILQTIEELAVIGEQLRAELETFRKGVVEASGESKQG